MIAWRDDPAPLVTRDALAAGLAELAAAVRQGGDYALYEALCPKLCRCDGCGGACDLDDDGTVVTGDDEVICGACIGVRTEEP